MWSAIDHPTMRREIEPAFPGPEVGDVGHPKHVGRRGAKASLDEIVGDADAGHPDRGATTLARDQPGDAGGPHEALHALARDHDALAEPQLGLHAPRPVDATVLRVDGLDLLDQPRVAQRTVRRRPTRPRVEPRRRDAEQLAGHGDRGAGLLRQDDPVARHRVPLSVAKKAAARLSRSRSWRSLWFSRRNLASSARSSVVTPSSRSRRSIWSWRRQLRNAASGRERMVSVVPRTAPPIRRSSVARRSSCCAPAVRRASCLRASVSRSRHSRSAPRSRARRNREARSHAPISRSSRSTGTERAAALGRRAPG